MTPDDATESVFEDERCEHTDRGTGQCPNRATRTVFIARKNTYKHLCDEHARRVGPDGRDSGVSAR